MGLQRQMVKKHEKYRKLGVSSITIPGGGDREVETYDTCDAIRTNIVPFLPEPGVSRARFL